LALTLDGTVVERCYVGASTRYTLEADGEVYVAVVAASDVGGRSLQPGQRTRFGWAAGDAVVLPLDAADPLPDDREEKA
jgi:putative spermidine/putrescine transport system ATP-binding protein